MKRDIKNLLIIFTIIFIIQSFAYGEENTRFKFEIWEDSNGTTSFLDYEEGLKAGRKIGELAGEYAAIKDFLAGKTNVWTRHKVEDRRIMEKYKLYYEKESYKEGFLIGYWEGFLNSYRVSYRKIKLDEVISRFYTGTIALEGNRNISIPGDNKFSLSIEPGTYYNMTLVNISSIPEASISYSSSNLTQVSSIYKVEILNPGSYYNKNKKVKVKFKFYDWDEKYGIYKYANNKWEYIPTKEEDNYLVAELGLGESGNLEGIFALCLDKEYVDFYDTRGHWAKDEIKTYVKRKVFKGYPDGKFKPNNKVTRGEFLVLLSRFYDWDLSVDTKNVEKFLDYKDLGFATRAISYSIDKNIIKGYLDNTFKPNDFINYREVEEIMGRILQDRKFSWDKYAKDLMYEKAIRSKSFTSKDKGITRGELAYMFYKLENL